MGESQDPHVPVHVPIDQLGHFPKIIYEYILFSVPSFVPIFLHMSVH